MMNILSMQHVPNLSPRKRKVDCKIFLEFSKTVAVLPDHKCPGPKPPETEIW